MRVLLVLDHAPDYREEFLQALGRKCFLTVLSQSCSKYYLTPPDSRNGYKYIERDCFSFGFFHWQREFGGLIKSEPWDVVCVALNFHHVWRFVPFIFSPGFRTKWVWWGHIYGKSSTLVLSCLRRYVLASSMTALVYSEDIASRVRKEVPGLKVVSFNNTQAKQSDFTLLPFRPSSENEARLLFVGRPQDRKRLHILVDIAKRRPDVQVRLVGPRMQSYIENLCQYIPENVSCFEETKGDALEQHFAWCDVVANPGHIGLLAVNAAQHGRPLAIQTDVVHAPEAIVAREAHQIFIDFNDMNMVDWLIDRIKNERFFLQKTGEELYKIGVEKYTIENMVEKHLEVFWQLVPQTGTLT